MGGKNDALSIGKIIAIIVKKLKAAIYYNVTRNNFLELSGTVTVCVSKQFAPENSRVQNSQVKQIQVEKLKLFSFIEENYFWQNEIAWIFLLILRHLFLKQPFFLAISRRNKKS